MKTEKGGSVVGNPSDDSKKPRSPHLEALQPSPEAWRLPAVRKGPRQRPEEMETDFLGTKLL